VSLGRQSYSSRRDTIAFVTCLLLSVVARADPLGVSGDVAAALRETVFYPPIYLQKQTQLMRDRRSDFDSLTIRLDSAVRAAQGIETLRAENVRLRTLLGLSRRVAFRYVAGEILHQVAQTDLNTVVVTAGTDLGVTVWAPVVSPRGLVGYVHQVGRSTSVVNAWTHPTFRASAETSDGTVTGLVAPRSGTGPTTALEMREVPHLANLERGTPVYTTGLGGVYPRGLLIGTAGALISEQAGLSKTYLIDPAVHPAAVSHVLILLSGSTPGVDLAPLFNDSAR
jgi:rod shape-determining protein MreC